MYNLELKLYCIYKLFFRFPCLLLGICLNRTEQNRNVSEMTDEDDGLDLQRVSTYTTNQTAIINMSSSQNASNNAQRSTQTGSRHAVVINQ